MKKISAIFLAFLLLVSAISVTASAESDAVNYALTGQYVITPGNDTGFLSSEDGTSYYGDDDCTILNDGVKPYYEIEEPGLGVVLIGSGAAHVVTYDLGATYDDIHEITFCNVWDSFNFGYALSPDGTGNRGFLHTKAIIRVSADGVNFERTKDYEIIVENHTEDGSENGFYNYRFKFNAPVTAKAIEMVLQSPSYCLSLSEIEIWGYGHSIPTPEVSIEESSEEEIEESSEAEIEEESSEEVEESKEESKEESEESKAESVVEPEKSEDLTPKEPSNGWIWYVAGGVILVAAIVVVIIAVSKGKKNKQ